MPDSSSPFSPPLPIIDITPYLPSSSSSSSPAFTERAKVAQSLHQACRDVGFFYLRISSFLDPGECSEILELGREFFRWPQEEKDAIGLEKSDGCRGYQKLHQNITQGKADHHEGLDFYAPSPYPPTHTSSDASGNGNGQGKLRPLEGPNLWPEKPERMRGVLEGWVEKMKVLGMAVMRGMADGLGMSEGEWEGLRGMVDDTFWVMRLIGYPPLPEGADGVSCGDHKDYGCLTFLLADPCPGSLQVLSKSSSSSPSTWLPADPIPGCVVVNIGAMWELWSGGLYPATLHRVVHRNPVYRVSVPFFFETEFRGEGGGAGCR